MKELIIETGYEDTSVIDDLLKGCQMAGTTPHSGAFPRRMKVASSTLEQVLKQSKWRTPVIEASMMSSFNPETGQVVYDNCTEEASKGWILGPFSKQQVDTMHPEVWLLAKRLAIVQNNEYRIIDDCLESCANDALTTTEKLDLHDIDMIAAAARP